MKSDFEPKTLEFTFSEHTTLSTALVSYINGCERFLGKEYLSRSTFADSILNAWKLLEKINSTVYSNHWSKDPRLLMIVERAKDVSSEKSYLELVEEVNKP